GETQAGGVKVVASTAHENKRRGLFDALCDDAALHDSFLLAQQRLAEQSKLPPFSESIPEFLHTLQADLRHGYRPAPESAATPLDSLRDLTVQVAIARALSGCDVVADDKSLDDMPAWVVRNLELGLTRIYAE